MLHSVCQKVWKSQHWPQGWKRAVLTPIPNSSLDSCLQPRVFWACQSASCPVEWSPEMLEESWSWSVFPLPVLMRVGLSSGVLTPVVFGSKYRHWPKVASFPTLNKFFFFFYWSLGQTSSFIDLSRVSLWIFPVCWPHCSLALISWVTLGNLFNLS